jgi:uncharacterized protein (DUF433 family)
MKREDMKAAAKFRPVCECGQRAPRYSTVMTADRWMQQHEAEHRAGDLSKYHLLDARAGRMGGVVCIKGTRIPADVIAQLVDNRTIFANEVNHYYPGVTREAAEQASAWYHAKQSMPK